MSSDVDYLHENYVTPHSKLHVRTNNMAESFNVHSFWFQCSNGCFLLAAYHLKACLTLGLLQMSGSEGQNS